MRFFVIGSFFVFVDRSLLHKTVYRRYDMIYNSSEIILEKGRTIMLFSDINLPKKLSEYLDEIYADEELKDAFYYSDVDIIGPESIVELMEDESLWLEPGEANYEMKPFAVSGDGGTWVILNDEHIGYVGSEGECGIVARNVDEFMNLIAVCKLMYFRMDDLKDEESFRKSIDAAYEEYKNPSLYNKFIEKYLLDSFSL